MSSRHRAVSAFLLTSFPFAAAAVAALISWDPYTVHLRANAFHTELTDRVMSVLTHLADGLVPTALAIILLFRRNWRDFLLMALGAGLSAVVVQVLKRQVFEDHHRPAEHLAQLPGLPLVDGVELNHHFSFPSGHSTAAYSMCLALAVVVGGHRSGMWLAVSAALLAFTRVYLSQHFTQDILAGAALGTGVTLGVYHVLYRSRWSAAPWLERAPLRRQK